LSDSDLLAMPTLPAWLSRQFIAVRPLTVDNAASVVIYGFTRDQSVVNEPPALQALGLPSPDAQTREDAHFDLGQVALSDELSKARWKIVHRGITTERAENVLKSAHCLCAGSLSSPEFQGVDICTREARPSRDLGEAPTQSGSRRSQSAP
jgi:hypothetical protein